MKTGSLKFISHLDLNRTVKSAFIRSKLPIYYTQGFNPHPKTVFSLPLSVGTASLCEFMDFKMTEAMDGKTVVDRLNAVFPDGLRAVAAYMPTAKFSDIGFADYEIRIEGAYGEDTAKKLLAALSGEILVEKTGKAGTKTVDIAPYSQVLSILPEEMGLVMRLRLSCNEMTFVNPKYIIDYGSAKVGVPSARDDYSICRTEVYLADGVTPFL